MPHYLLPRLPAPANVKAVITTRGGGVSKSPFTSFNLATHVGDDPRAVAQNRAKLKTDWDLAEEPRWLKQVHSSRVINLDNDHGPEPEADAAFTTTPGTACVVLTADCLPVLFCNREGTKVGIAHAGWRGLAAGILRNTVAAMSEAPEDLLAYLGPAIGQEHFEVGEEVRDSFVRQAMDAGHGREVTGGFQSGPASGKLYADLYMLARVELNRLGLTEIHGGDHCTIDEKEIFYSFRRDGETGRMASLIWIS